MKTKLFLIALSAVLIFCGTSFAANTMPGDVIVIFENPSENDVSAASLAEDGEHSSYLASVASEFDAQVAMTYDYFSENSNEIFALLHSDTKSEQELLAELLARPDVKGASLNYISYPTKTPNDKYYSVLWGPQAIRANEVWDKTTGSDSIDPVYVAVIDSGIDSSHPDLKANIATEYCIGYGYNSYGQPASSREEQYWQDDASVGHGTHVSGTIGAVGNNGEGVAGVNWTTKIIMLKPYVTVGNKTGFPDNLIIFALQEVKSLKDSGVNIAAVNMSLGGWVDRGGTPAQISNSKNPYWAALKAVSDSGIVLCVAAGNEDQAVGVPAPIDDFRQDQNGKLVDQYKKGEYVYPASFLDIPNMIVVAAASMDVNGNYIRSVNESGSNYSSEYVHITAPGAHIVSTTPTEYQIDSRELVETGVSNYAVFSGTSMATPHVSGAVALLKAAYPKATAASLKKAILDGANGNYCRNDSVTYDDGGTHTTDSTSKYGFLDVKAAYDLLPSIIATQKEETTSSGGSGGGCDLIRNEKLGIRNVLILCAFILLSLGVMKLKRS